MNQPRDDQSCQAGKCCGAQEKDHGTGCDLAGCAGISDTGDTHDNGTEDQWKDHHVQGIHVNASDKACDGKYRFETVCQKQSGNDTKDQTGKDCCGNMFFIPRIEFFHLFPPLYFYFLIPEGLYWQTD